MANNQYDKVSKKEAIEIASKGELYLLKSTMRNDRDIVLAAVKHNGQSMCWASKRLQDDDEIIETAIQTYPLAIRNASERLKNNRDIIKDVCSRDQRCFEYASDKLKNNKELVIELAKYSTKIANMLPYVLQDDEEVCRAYISNHGFAIRYFSLKLRNDPKIMALAIEHSRESVFQYAGNELKDLVGKNNPTIFLEAINLKDELSKDLVENKTLPRKMKV